MRTLKNEIQKQDGDCLADFAGGKRRATKTKIMYKAFLSYAQLREYLSTMIESGLLDYDSKTLEYKTTDKGHKFLKAYDKMEQISINGEEKPARAWP